MRASFLTDPTRDAAHGGRTPIAAVLGAAAFLVLLWVLVAPAPFLSEDWTQFEALRGVDSLASALAPAREPLRPLQHAFLWTLTHCGADPAGNLPAAARAAALALLLGACVAVAGLARRAGLGARGAALALLLFAAFPSAKILAWSAAIGSPGRVAFELAALVLLVRRAQGGAAWTGCGGLAAFVVALGFHESAFLLPAILLAWIATIGVAKLADGIRRALASLRDPFVLAACALASFHVLHLLFFRPDRVHGAKDPAALPANVVKAVLALAPEALRELGVEGLRGHRGLLGLAAGGLVVLAVLLVLALLLRRGGVARFAALAISLDLGLAVLGAGFVQRYACLAAAFAALAVASWAVTPRRVLLAGILGLLWAHDAVVDALEIRAAGRASLEIAAAARGVPGDGPLALVGLPDMAGSEQDVPWFNWGGAFFLRAHGVERPVTLLRERAFRTNSDQELVDAERLARIAASGVLVRRWIGPGEPFAPYPP